MTVLRPDDSLKYDIAVLCEDSAPSVSPSGVFYYRAPTTTANATWTDEEYASNQLIAIDPSGAEAWRFDPQAIADVEEGTILSVVVGGFPLVGDDETIYARMVTTYEVPWTPPSFSSVSTLPPLPASQAALVALNPDGMVRWQRGDVGWPLAQASDHRIYAVDNYLGHSILCVGPGGEDVWTLKLDYSTLHGDADSMISDAAYNLFVKYNMRGSGDGAVVAVDPAGNLLWNNYSESRQIEWGEIAMGLNGVLYFVEEHGPLVAVGH